MSLLNNLGSWTAALPATLAAFMASLVEFVEALTIVLAVGITRGWRAALLGSAAALAVLAALVVVLGPSLTRIPLAIVQLVVGTLLLMFGLRWLRKAVLRGAGVLALHDEAAAFEKETALLQAHGGNNGGALDKVAFATAFKIVMLEGIEVVFIVIAIGASGQMLVPATLGALAALVLVIALGLVLHRPLARVPENSLKFGVGVLLCAFGTFWVGEGVGLAWPGEDWAALGLVAGYLAMAMALVPLCRKVSARPGKRSAAVKKSAKPGTANKPVGWLRRTLSHLLGELVSLFVDDGLLAGGTVAWVLLAWGLAGLLAGSMRFVAPLFACGFLALLAVSALRRAAA